MTRDGEIFPKILGGGGQGGGERKGEDGGGERGGYGGAYIMPCKQGERRDPKQKRVQEGSLEVGRKYGAILTRQRKTCQYRG